MAFKPKTLICCDCMAPFAFSAEEQMTYSFKGMAKGPSRCPECRASREALRVSRASTPAPTARRKY